MFNDEEYTHSNKLVITGLSLKLKSSFDFNNSFLKFIIKDELFIISPVIKLVTSKFVLTSSSNLSSWIAFKIEFSQEELDHTFEEQELEFILKRFERVKGRLMNDIYVLENEDALGLYMGKCNLCMRCTREFGMPCKMPVKMRYAIEGLGADVDKTIEDLFGYKILYAHDGKLPEYLIFVGGLLYDKK